MMEPRRPDGIVSYRSQEYVLSTPFDMAMVGFAARTATLRTRPF